MDYTSIFKRAFEVTFKYRALWIFGFFLALCSANGGGNGGGQNFTSGPDGFGNGPGSDFFPPGFDIDPAAIFTIIALIFCLVVVLAIIGAVVRSVTRASLIGMVDQIEERDTVTVKEGWRFGWSKSAVNIFLINLVVIAPLVVLFLGLFGVAILFFVLAADGGENPAMGFFGIFSGIGLLLLGLFLIFIIALVITPWLELSWRFAVLQGTGALDSLKRSFALIRQNWKAVILTWLLLIGAGIGWAIVSIFLGLFVIIVGAIVGAVPGLIVYLLSQIAWAAILAGLPFFLIVVIIPLTFAQGLFVTFRSGVWTLAFRTLIGEEASTPQLDATAPASG